MFFRRKPTPPQEERRAIYRKPPALSQGLSIVVRGPSGYGIGLLHDLSAQGAGVSFPQGQDPRLSIDDEVAATIQSLSHGELHLTARVVHGAQQDQDGASYGLEFLDAEQALSDLNPFFARLFNRRSAPRVRPSLDRRVTLQMSWEGGEVEARVNELSVTGIGITLPLVDAYRVMNLRTVYLRFRLPGLSETFEGPAMLINRRPAEGVVSLGLAFDLQDPDGLARNLEALQAYVERRAAEMQRWESSGG